MRAYAAQDVEFTVQDGILFMLQCRSGKRTGPAALQVCAVVVVVVSSRVGRRARACEAQRRACCDQQQPADAALVLSCLSQVAIDMFSEGLITSDEAVMLVSAAAPPPTLSCAHRGASLP